ncbi:hypothetical protein QP150_06100 [Sphingomonas sp. 22L2VL55-3]
MTFTDRKGRARSVRYRFVPAAGEHYFGTGAGPAPDYLQPEIAKRVTDGPVRFDWYAQLGEPGDLLDDPSIAWPPSRKLVKLGTITIAVLAANTAEADRGLTFLPGRMPDGIAAADPMLAIRTEAYPVSFGERQQFAAARPWCNGRSPMLKLRRYDPAITVSFGAGAFKETQS